MALSIVPILLSLLPSPPAGDLLVHVVDKDGKPVAGAQVALGSRMEAHGPFPPPEMYYDLQLTNPQTGCARFVDLARYGQDPAHMKCFVRLGVAGGKDVEALLSTDKPESDLTLTMPECAQVILRAPFRGQGKAQLRGAIPAGSPSPFWRSRQPPTAELVDGVARFEFVAPGVELEYRINSPELPTELRGTFQGPARKGERIEFAVKGLEGNPTLVLTLVDESLKPIADLQFDWTVSLTRGNNSSSSGGHVRSDEKGRVRIPLVGAQAEAGDRQVSLSAWSESESARRLGSAYGSIAIPPDFERGERDLGELVVASYGSPGRFLRVDDGALMLALDASRAGSMRSSQDAGGAFDEVLCEMVRRGSPALATFLVERLKALRADPDSPSKFLSEELAVLTALRRIQGKPDPLRPQIESTSVLETTFPDSPRIHFSLRNVDSESFPVAEGGSYRSGRFGRCAFHGTGPRGAVLGPRDWDAGEGGGMFRMKVLEPGASIDYSIALADYVRTTLPGDYRVRLIYKDDEEIASTPSMQGRIAFSSDEFRVSVRARRVELSEARRDELRRAFRSLDTAGRIPLASGHWHEGLKFEGECKKPADTLFRAGWQSLPILLEALEDPSVDRVRRAWALGMLWNIAGVQNPLLCLGGAGLGRFEWIGKWPTSTEDAQRGFGEFSNPSDAPIWDESEDKLTRLWLEWKPMIEVKIVP